MITSETNSRALVRNSIVLSAALGALAVVMIAVVSILGAIALGADFALWASAAIAAGAGLGIAAILLRTWENVRYMLVETIAAANAKHKAEAEKILAEADRIDAESEAIKRAAENSSALQINNASNGGKITKPQLHAPTVRIQGKEVSWNQINQIGQSAPEPRRIEIPAEDVKFFCDEIARGVKHTKATWLGRELPNSRLAVSWEIYRAFVDPLAEGGQIVGRGPKASGRLVETDPSHLLAALNEHYPTGIVIEVPNQIEN